MISKSPGVDAESGLREVWVHELDSGQQPFTPGTNPTWAWVDGGKAHLADCAYIRAQVSGEAEGRYAPHTELTLEDFRRWIGRLHLADQYPGDIPICHFCEQRGA